jgi:hypothetical protein
MGAGRRLSGRILDVFPLGVLTVICLIFVAELAWLMRV